MERDDLIADESYARSANHSEEHGKQIRKTVWKVTFILTLITVIEVVAGVMFPKNTVSEGVWAAIKLSYIILTLVKAGYIVLVFMHLGDEKKTLKWMILIPYAFFILYLIVLMIGPFGEAPYINSLYETFSKP